jgi:hypothetical protein
MELQGSMRVGTIEVPPLDYASFRSGCAGRRGRSLGRPLQGR